MFKRLVKNKDKFLVKGEFKGESIAISEAKRVFEGKFEAEIESKTSLNGVVKSERFNKRSDTIFFMSARDRRERCVNCS
jgi:hypothetical protein